MAMSRRPRERGCTLSAHTRKRGCTLFAQTWGRGCILICPYSGTRLHSNLSVLGNKAVLKSVRTRERGCTQICPYSGTRLYSYLPVLVEFDLSSIRTVALFNHFRMRYCLIAVLPFPIRLFKKTRTTAQK